MKSCFWHIALLVFVLSFSGLNAQIRLISPQKVEIFRVGSTATISWSGQPQNSSVSLWYSKDDGKLWSLIAVNLPPNSYDWTIPDIPTDSIRFRVLARPSFDSKPLLEIRNAHQDQIRSIEFSSDGTNLLSASYDGVVKIWRISDGIAIDSSIVPNQSPLISHFIGSTKDTICTISTQSIGFWIRGNGTFIWNVPDDSLRALEVHPSQNIIATGGDGAILRVWRWKFVNSALLLELLREWKQNIPKLYTIKFSPDGKYLAYAGDNGYVYVREWETDNQPAILSRHGRNNQNFTVWSCDFSHDGTHIVSGGVDNSVRFWRTGKNDTTESIFLGHTFHVRSVRFSPQGSYPRILSGSLDSTIRQWDAETFSQIGAPLNHGGQVLSVDYSPTGDSAVSTGRDNAIRLWKTGANSTSADTSAFLVQHQAVLEIPDLTGKIGKIVNIPVIWRNRNSLFSVDSVRFRILIQFPSELLSVIPSENRKIGRYSATIDTASVEITAKNSDTVAIIPARVLLGQPQKQAIVLSQIFWETTNRYFEQTRNGSIAISGNCGNFMQELVGFSSGAGILGVSPNPSSDRINIHYVLPSDDEMSLGILDIRGKSERILKKGAVKLGDFQENYELADLSEGEYFVLLKTANQNFAVKIVVKK